MVDQQEIRGLALQEILITRIPLRGIVHIAIFNLLLKMDDPSAPPASGDTNFTQGILLLTIIPTTASATVAGLRFATRAWIVKALGWDDYTMMLAIVSRSQQS
ncbi:MAG: hypothetical protein L6R41_006417 [Letrouitia leprolyta]|nr:MAG: hypothetical protein L6R41_006417 [Letrouitia leprolyta]